MFFASKVAETLRFLDSLSQMANAGISANISALLEYSREQQQGASQTVRTSTLLAGHDLLLAAQGTLHWQGTQAQAGNDLGLMAGTGLVLESARNRQQYREESLSGSVQYDLYGTSAGALNVSLSGSQYQQVGVTQVNSHAFAGGDLRLDSGGDATVAGAVVECIAALPLGWPRRATGPRPRSASQALPGPAAACAGNAP